MGKRRELIGELEKIMHEDGPIAQPIFRNNFTFYDKSVHGVRHPSVQLLLRQPARAAKAGLPADDASAGGCMTRVCDPAPAIAEMLLTFVVASFLVFVVTEFSPGNVARKTLGAFASRNRSISSTRNCT